MGTGKWPRILNLGGNTYSVSGPDIWFLSKFLCHVTLKLAQRQLWFWKKFSSDLSEIWYVGRGRWVMHDSMQYDPIQRQGQDHEPLKARNLTIFDGYLLPHL